jgi:hypothetical protein
MGSGLRKELAGHGKVQPDGCYQMDLQKKRDSSIMGAELVKEAEG